MVFNTVNFYENDQGQGINFCHMADDEVCVGFENYPKDVKEAYPKRRTALVAVVETLYDRRRCIQRKKADVNIT
ncbi:hypothetical protein X801_07756 [Opisthorchis viverrini]|uniref:Uncharacterized protein n=1 Tax=Opisthorchis viverrini TaxID=6198 RepID=A0A1S8WPM0_OPIVI|nr:hypothetical protein X801_07756 [Opisthorchis viverrini]